ncbi:MAG: hypothetical protein RLZZ299_134 [Pseudomonadota bacterium]
MRVLSRLVLLVLVPAMLAQPAGATSLARLSVEQMTDASDLVVRGEVVAIDTDVDDRGQVVSHAEIRVAEGLKGHVSAGDHVTVETPGGALETYVARVDGAARYSVGEQVFVFLSEKRGGTSYGTVGMFLGKYTVKQDPRTGADMAVQFTVPWGQVYDARFIPNPPASERLGAATLADRVRARVTAGWDGEPIPGADPARLRQINSLQPGVR